MNRPPLSLRWRLMALILVPLTLISIATGYWRFSGAEQTANEVFDQTLVALLLAVSKDVSTSGGDVLSEATSQLLGNIYSDRLYYHVHGPDGAFTTGYATPPVKPPELTVTEDIPVLYDSRYRGRPVRVAKLMERTSLDTLSGLSAVTVWQPVSGRQAIAGRIAGRALIVIISLYLTVAGVIFFGIKLGLRPLTSLQSAIALRSGDDLSQIRRPVPVEVNGLVETLNGLFHQVTAVLESRDRFISDAAHQLRNPIAGLLSVAEAAGAATNAKDRAQRVWDVINAARHVSRVTHQLLSLERIKASSGATHFRPVDLRNIVRTVCERNARTILAGETDFAFDMADVPVMV